MKNLSRRALLRCAPIIFAAIFSGCLSPIAIQAVGGVAGGAGSSASEYQGAGKGESYFIAQYEDVVKAVLKTGDILSLELKEKKADQDRASLHYQGGKNKQIKLLIERQTETMTSILFDVGWTGSIALGRLMARQIDFELDKANAFLVDWSTEVLR